MDVRKEPGGVMRHSVSREDMILINRLSKTELKPDQVYTFAILLSPISIILIQQQNGSKSPVFITFMAQKIPRTAGPQGPAAGGFHLTESVSYFS